MTALGTFFLYMKSLILPAMATALLACGCSGDEDSKPSDTKGPAQISGLKSLGIKDVMAGDGKVGGLEVGPLKVEHGDLISVIYSGKLLDGTEFDTTMEKDATPFAFVMGQGAVIRGWDEGLVGMKIGGVRELAVPWTHGYGEGGFEPDIPAKADLYFTVKLLDIVKKGQEAVFDSKDVALGKGKPVVMGSNVKFFYTGSFVNGNVFDSNVGKAPMEAKLGETRLIKGLVACLIGMRKGGERLIRIPPAIGYGESGITGIPGNTTLLFKVKLVDVL